MARSSVLAPLLQVYVNGDTPALTVRFTEPLAWPQLAATVVVDKLTALRTTVTVKEQAEVLPEASVAVTFTVVVPALKAVPEAGT